MLHCCNMINLSADQDPRSILKLIRFRLVAWIFHCILASDASAAGLCPFKAQNRVSISSGGPVSTNQQTLCEHIVDYEVRFGMKSRVSYSHDCC